MSPIPGTMESARRWLRTIALTAAAVPWAAPSRGEVHLVDEPNLRRLAEGMDKSLARIESLRGTVHSISVSSGVDQPNLMVEVGPTHWVSRGERYHFTTREFATRTAELQPDAAVHGSPDAGPGSSAVEVGRSTGQFERMIERSATADSLIEIDSKRPGRATVHNPREGKGPRQSDRLRHDPRCAGLTVMGVTLSEIMAGRSWRLSPEDAGLEVKRTVRWAGERDFDGRTLEVVTVEAAWHQKGHDVRRSYDLYVDPDRSYTVPLVVGTYQEGDQQSPFERFEVSLREQEPGLWVPVKAMHQVMLSAPNPKGEVRTTSTYTDIAVNDPVSDEQLQVMLEPDTVVHDRVLDYRYKFATGDDREALGEIRQTLAQTASVRRALPVRAQSGDGASVLAALSGSWDWWIIGGLAFGVVIGAGLVLRRSVEVSS